MKYDPRIHHRRSIRLANHDYSEPGIYFVTLCVKNRESLLGAVVNNEMKRSAMGDKVRECWEDIPKHFKNAELDRYIVMPNHMHGILILKELLVGTRQIHSRHLVGVEYIQPQRKRKKGEFQHVIPGSVGSIVRSFKAAVTRICRKKGFNAFEWQRDYYDHIIRDGEDLDRIRKYIMDNSISWHNDENFPKNLRMDNKHEGTTDWSPLD